MTTEEPDEMGVTRSRNLTPTPAKLLEPSEDDHWPVCRHAQRYANGKRRGELVLDKNGAPVCFCECIDRTGRHRLDHDAAGTGKCIFCGTSL